MFFTKCYIFYDFKRNNNQQLSSTISELMDSSQKIMNEDYLNVAKMTDSELQQLYQKQQHATWKALIKVQQSKRMIDIPKAISELKIARSFVINFSRQTVSKENQRIYFKTIIHTLSLLLNYLLQVKNFKQSLIVFKEMYEFLHDLSLLKQALFNMFGLSSLICLLNYNLQSNAQFKYPPQSQAQFLYIVAKIKRIAGKDDQAKNAFEKVLLLSKSSNISRYLLIRIFDTLADIEPLKYRSEYQKLCKSYSPQLLISNEQKLCFQQILKKLLIRQKILISQISSKQNKSKINNRLLYLYLNNIIRYDKIHVEMPKNFGHQILEKLKQQKNQNLLNQMVHSSSISKDAQKIFNDRLNGICRITILYYFRKLLQSKKILNKTPKSNMPVIPNLKQRDNLDQKSSLSKVSKSIYPSDYKRAQQILKKCVEGNYLLKINLGNSSVARRFVRIQEKALVWGKTVQDAEYSSSSCKWKNVLGLTYGKVSQNLSKEKFWQIDAWKCFSLITKERSFDFCCQDQANIFFWLQAISYKLQVFHNKNPTYPYYSKGRALWKMALMKMKSKYKEPKKKYKCQNAGAIITFQKLRFL